MLMSSIWRDQGLPWLMTRCMAENLTEQLRIKNFSQDKRTRI